MEKSISAAWGNRWDNPDMDVVRLVIQQVQERSIRYAGFSVNLIADQDNHLEIGLNIDKEISLLGIFDSGGDFETRLEAKSRDWDEVEKLIKAFLDNDLEMVKTTLKEKRNPSSQV